jgi:uncharacterized surface protein with fasciclin (FAS1) repeats
MFHDVFDWSDGPYTVFAPSEAAFASLMDEVGFVRTGDMALDMRCFVNQNPEWMIEIARHHIVRGQVRLDPIWHTEAQYLQTMRSDGDGLYLVNCRGGAFVDTAAIIETNIEADNTLVHVIDRVLLPGDLPI